MQYDYVETAYQSGGEPLPQLGLRVERPVLGP